MLLGTKRCPDCLRDLDEKEFRTTINKQRKAAGKKYIGVCKRCRYCENERYKKFYYKHHPRMLAEARIKGKKRYDGNYRAYGLTKEQYDRMVEASNNTCYLCGGPPNLSKSRLCIDHCKETGIVRGLLCTTCNLGIGNLKHDTDLLRKSAEYLERSRKFQSLATKEGPSLIINSPKFLLSSIQTDDTGLD